MAIQVKIKQGYYRGTPFNGVYTLVRPYQEGAKGGFVTIRNPNPQTGTPPVQRISVQRGDFVIVDNGVEIEPQFITDKSIDTGTLYVTENYEQRFLQTETEEEAMSRIQDTFAMLDKIVDASAKNIIRGLVISGPPGVGKSFSVEKQLNAANMFNVIAGNPDMFEIVSGGVSPIGLYQILYHRRQKDNVLVFDDCDSALLDTECLNLLKAALNSGDRRKISWNKESKVLNNEDIPRTFDFDASIIFISNIDFDRSIRKGSSIAVHLEAIMSRCHYIDLEIGCMRDKLLRIKQMCKDGMLAEFNFTEEQNDAIIAFIFDNAEHLREVSLRLVKKLADLVKADPIDWYAIAEATLLNKDAKFKRLLKKRESK